MKTFGIALVVALCAGTTVGATGHGNIWLTPSDYDVDCNENGAKITLKSNNRAIYIGKSCDSAIPEADWAGNWFSLENGDFYLDTPGLLQFRGPLQCDGLPTC